MTEINRDYQSLVNNIVLGKYGYIEIQGYEDREPEKRLTVRAYESIDSDDICGYFHLEEERRESVRRVAERYGIKFEVLPDLATATKVQNEFEGWITRIKEKNTDQISHYEKAVKFAKELSHGVVRGYWRNEIAKPFDLFDLQRSEWSSHRVSTVARNRLYKYMTERIGYGTRTGQSYTTNRGANHYHGDDELGDIDLMISTMVGIGMLNRVGDSTVYELTGKAFDLLRTEPTELEELSRNQLKVERRLLLAIVAQAVIAAVAALPQFERLFSAILDWLQGILQ